MEGNGTTRMVGRCLTKAITFMTKDFQIVRIGLECFIHYISKAKSILFHRLLTAET